MFACEEKTAEERLFSLAVTNGNGSGNYPANKSIDISANPPGDGEMFDSWTGDISTVSDITQSTTKLVMPAADTEVIAVYKPAPAVSIVIDKTKTFQTIDGFGFFGGRDSWWSSPNSQHFYSAAWLDKIITDLGITVWRNEVAAHNPPDQVSSTNQDSNWAKQKDLIVALNDKAKANGVDLKVILTAWTPPVGFKWAVSNFSWAGDPNAVRAAGNVSEKNGGTLNPNMYNEFAQWWNAAIDMYNSAGVNVHAISYQNEPMFSQPYNSAVYTVSWYAELLDNVTPLVKAKHPQVKIFGSEHMLEMEGKSNNYPFFYHAGIISNAKALAGLDIFAVHGYLDGVRASSGTELAGMWTNHKNQFSIPGKKKTWMTETSGYVDNWEKVGTKPGAFSLAVDIQTALNFGDVSAWVYWQGSELSGINEFNLMSDLTVGKKYYASKNFYRFIRPGAVRVDATSSDPEVAVSAFVNASKGTQTIVITNASAQSRRIELAGAGLASEFELFVTSADKNCEAQGVKANNSAITIPARSVVTLQAGGTAL